MKNIFSAMKRIRVFIFIVSILLGNKILMGQNYVIKTYTQEDGLPNLYVNDILQGSLGRMWIATRGGIALYDGLDWTNYSTEDGLANNEVYTIRQDSSSTIWALTSKNKIHLSYFKDNHWINLDEPNIDLPKDFLIRSFNVIRSNDNVEIVLTTKLNGIFYYDGKKWLNINKNDGLPSNSCSNVTVYENKFYVATESGIAIIQKGRIDNSLNKIIPENHKVVYAIKFEKMKSGERLWVLSKNCLGYIQNNFFTALNESLNIKDDSNDEVMQFIPEYYGFAVWGNFYGLRFYNKAEKNFLTINEVSGIRVLSPSCIFLDREWNLWIAGRAGINKLSSMRYATYRQRSGLMKDEVTAITERNKNEMVFGHVNGLSIFKENKFNYKVFEKNENLYNKNKVLDLCTDKSQNVWIAAEKLGLGKLSPDNNLKWYKIPGEKKVSDFSSVAIDSDGVLQVLSGDEYYRFVNNKFAHVQIPDSTQNKYLRKIFIAPNNDKYIVTSTAGIIVYDKNNNTRIIKSKSDYKANNVFSLCFCSDNKIYVGTQAGLYIVEADSLKKIQYSQIQIDNPIYFITEDHDRDLWFGTNSGVIKWSKGERFEYTIRSGLAGMEANRDAGFVDSNGRMWIGTDRGVSKYQKEFDIKPNLSPSLLLETIEPRIGLIIPSGNLNINSVSASIVFRVKIISFIDEFHNQFAYKLEGFEKDWNFSNARNPLIRYTNLPAGNYRLVVKCQNALGLWSGDYTVGNIEIPEPFYKTWWFFTLAVLMTGLVVVGFVNYQMKERYSQKLQFEVNKRTVMLYESEHRYRQMFEKNQAVMLLLDAQTLDIVDVNEAAERFYGFDKNTLINFNYTRISTTGSVEDILERIKNAIIDKRQKVSVHRIAKGNETFVEISFSEINVRERALYYAIIHDVGARIYAEEALKESEEKYRTLIESMKDGVFVIQDAKMLFVNSAVSNFMGYAQEEMIGKSFEEFIAPEDLPMVKSRYAARLRGEEVTTEYEFKLIHKDGSTRVFVFMHVSLFTYLGKPALLGTLRNITEDKIQELKLKQFYTAIEQAPVGVMITDFENNIEYVNPKFCGISGYSYEEFIGKKPFMLHAKNILEMSGRIRTEVKSGNIWSGEVLNRRKDGSTYWVMATVSPIRNAEGEITHFISVEQDITFEKYAREEIRRNEKLLSSIVNHAPVIISAIDQRGYVTFLRGRELESQGLLDDQLVGTSIFEYFKGDEDFKNEFIRALDGEVFSTIKKINDLAYELHFNPMFDGEGGISGSIVVALNITERYNAQQKLIAAKEEAERSDRLKSEFLAQMSHEIRTPVNTILNFTSLLQEEIKDKINPELSEVFNFIDDGGRRLIRTIDMILNMSQFQTGTYKPIVDVIDLNNDVLDKIVSELKTAAGHKNLELNLLIETQNVFVKADSYTVGQIFINLIDNAIKYTHHGHIDVKIRENDKNIIVDVEDTGIGISKEYIPHLFDAFSQEETGYSRRFEGTGLGLALVKKYSEINDASIKVESTKGEGTKFSVCFNKIKPA